MLPILGLLVLVSYSGKLQMIEVFANVHVVRVEISLRWTRLLSIGKGPQSLCVQTPRNPSCSQACLSAACISMTQSIYDS